MQLTRADLIRLQVALAVEVDEYNANDETDALNAKLAVILSAPENNGCPTCGAESCFIGDRELLGD